MKETRADTVQAAVLALGLHVLLFAIALLGIWWTRNTAPVSAAGPVIEAELISPDALSPAMQQVLLERPDPAEPAPAEPEPEPVRREEIPPPRPMIEPVPQLPEPQPVPQERIPEPDTVEQDRASERAIADREAAEREQEERRRQEQIDLTERQRQEEIERERARQSEMERQRIQQQLDAIRRQREEVAREAERAQQKLDQLAAAQEAARMDSQPESPPPGNEGPDASLLARYQAALQRAIVSQWTRPDTVPLGQRCRIVIRQVQGGQVIDAKVDASCPYDEQGRRSIEAAVLKAQPLPYAGFESVFNRTLILNFEAQDR